MHAELCQLLARAIQSPYYRQEQQSFVLMADIELGDQALADWLIQQAIAAYTFEQLTPQIQGFLQDCDRSWQIEQAMFANAVKGTQAERDRQVIEQMEQSSSRIIPNKDRFPTVNWLLETEMRQIGTLGGVPLVLLGFEAGFEVGQQIPIVAQCHSADPSDEPLFAIPLYELMKLQEPLIVTEDFSEPD